MKMNNNPNSQCNYKVNAPYPPICVNGQNAVYASEMLSNVGGVVSEMSDVSRYFYNAVVTGQEYNSIAECFHHISIVEMHHLNIFAELALLLGADPRLWSGRTHKHWWTPAYNQYPREMRPLISCSIKAEQEAIYKYSKQADSIRDRNIVAILERIILDEERHIQIFNEMYQHI
ncbi:ferritin-like domain-containing protein [Faecalicatena contorta]|nr:ferritin family protein [Faecalicatena contorta]